jgi:hypothetical protein
MCGSIEIYSFTSHENKENICPAIFVSLVNYLGILLVV